MEKNSLFKYFENISQDKIYYPFAWLQEGVIEPSDVSKTFWNFPNPKIPSYNYIISLVYNHSSDLIYGLYFPYSDNSRENDVLVGTAG